MTAPRIAPEPPEPSGTADDPNDPDPCVCGALIASELLPMLRKASEAFAEVRHVIPTLEEVNRRLTVLEQANVPHELGHVCVYVDGFDRCSWCGVAR